MVEAAPAVVAPTHEMNPHATEYHPLGAAGLDSRIRKAQSKAAQRTGGSHHQQAKKSWKFVQPAVQPGPQQSSLLPEHLLGNWADSLGNSVLVFSVDAFQVRLCATLSQPPRHDITLKIQQAPGGGWICGNAMLDPMWSTVNQLHWLTTDGRISVWVRPEKGNAMATATPTPVVPPVTAAAKAPEAPAVPPAPAIVTGEPQGKVAGKGKDKDKDMW